MAKEYTVLKRNGQKAIYDVTKIRKAIMWALGGLEINPMELESNVEMSLRDGITTREIQQSLIYTALKLTTPEEPDWRYMAGRLQVFDLYKEVAIQRGRAKKAFPVYSDFHAFVKDSIEEGVYTPLLVEKYSAQELEKAGSFIKAEYDLKFDFAGINLLMKRYLIEHKDCVWELPQEMFMVISLLIEQNTDPKVRMEKVQDTYEKLGQLKISLATPFLMNAGFICCLWDFCSMDM